jgi:hypothetical protein
MIYSRKINLLKPSEIMGQTSDPIIDSLIILSVILDIVVNLGSVISVSWPDLFIFIIKINDLYSNCE